ncbi:MAG TPA: alanine racemase [Frankiaceae bacterium]|nr:alanine racemase [Frankiaceae bacterium]
MASAEAVIDLDAVRTSTAELVRRAGSAAVMAVVKADGYGHGMLPCARAALDAGAQWLGAAKPSEALQLRACGIEVPILAWLAGPHDDLAPAVGSGIDLSAGAPWMVRQLQAAAAAAGRPARVHLNVDTGLHREGATAADWPELLAAALQAQAEGTLEIIGIWSHFALADDPGHPTVRAQLTHFREALEVAERAGVHPQIRHLANSAATLANPDAHFDLVRPGVAVYGLSPGPLVGKSKELGLVPAMTLTAEVALTKRVPAGSGVSYGHRYHTSAEATLALVPLGYADGVPRHATNLGEVLIGGKRRRIAGTVCMDQFVVDVGDDPVAPGDRVVLFGPGDRGEPTAQDWAEAIGTINYEIVTRVGPRVPRRYVQSGGGS